MSSCRLLAQSVWLTFMLTPMKDGVLCSVFLSVSYTHLDGEALDDRTRELLKDSLEFAIRNAKMLAKEKYTPKKYKK